MKRNGIARVAAGLLALLCGGGLASAGSRSPSDDYLRPTKIPHPKDNAWTHAREDLGRVLFFDPRLSRSGIVSCASCHNPGFDYGDAMAVAVGDGMRTLKRRSPTLLNLAWAPALFWDGRAASLEEQALGPITSPDEMNLSLDELAKRVRGAAGYAPLFRAAYPGEPVGPAAIARAIAAYERTLTSEPSPFDRWVAGDEGAVSEAARRGFEVFEGKARCVQCHSGWRFTDDSFHDIGLAGSDRGRGVHYPDIEAMQFAFKTPTLRNVDRRAPYMHDGSVATLAEVIEVYDRGGDVGRPSLSTEIRRLDLSAEEKHDLLAFLGTLTSPIVSRPIPELPR